MTRCGNLVQKILEDSPEIPLEGSNDCPQPSALSKPKSMDKMEDSGQPDQQLAGRNLDKSHLLGVGVQRPKPTHPRTHQRPLNHSLVNPSMFLYVFQCVPFQNSRIRTPQRRHGSRSQAFGRREVGGRRGGWRGWGHGIRRQRPAGGANAPPEASAEVSQKLDVWTVQGSDLNGAGGVGLRGNPQMGDGRSQSSLNGLNGRLPPLFNTTVNNNVVRYNSNYFLVSLTFIAMLRWMQHQLESTLQIFCQFCQKTQQILWQLKWSSPNAAQRFT